MTRNREGEKEAEAAARAGSAQRLLDAFKRAGKLQAKGEPDRAWLAEEIGISVQAIGQALAGKTVFSAYTNARAARALGVNAHWLATNEESIEPPRLLQPVVAPQSAEEMGQFVGQLVNLFTQLDADNRAELLGYANKLAAGRNRRWHREPWQDERRRELGGIRPGDNGTTIPGPQEDTSKRRNQ